MFLSFYVTEIFLSSLLNRHVRYVKKYSDISREVPLVYLCICGYQSSEFFIYIFVNESTPSFDFFSFFSFFMLFLSTLLHMNKSFIPLPLPPSQANDEENNITHFVLLQIYNFFLFSGRFSSSAIVSYQTVWERVAHALGASRFGSVRWALIWVGGESEIYKRWTRTIYLKSFWLMMKWAMNLKLNVAFSLWYRSVILDIQLLTIHNTAHSAVVIESTEISW